MKELKRICRNCKYFISVEHHRSWCKLSKREGVNELHDGRAKGCKGWEEKEK